MSVAVWYWRQDKVQGGPITWEKLQAMAVKGKLGPNDWVLREGWNDWRLACEAQEDGASRATDEVPPLPPPLPLPEPNDAGEAMVPAPAFPGLPPALHVAPPPLAAAPGAPFAPMLNHPGAGPPPLMPPLPSLEPMDAVTDEQPFASPEGVSAGDVRQLRSILLNGPTDGQPTTGFNYSAAGAMAAAVIGLVALPFESGLVALALGGWCLMGRNDPANGRKLAAAAVALGGLNVVFRVLCATVDLGLQL